MESNFVDWFLENSYLPIYGVTLVLSIIQYPKYFDTSLKYFPILILYTFMNELLGVLIYTYDTFSLTFNNLYADSYMVIYNIYNVVFFLYFIYLFRSSIQNKKYKIVIKYAGFVFLAISLINPFIQNFFLEYQRMVFFIGSIILMGCIIVYLNENKRITRIFTRNNILVWLGLGLLVYHLGYFPIKIIRYYNDFEGIQENPNIRRIHLFLVLVMYTFFIVGFVRIKGKLSKKRH